MSCTMNIRDDWSARRKKCGWKAHCEMAGEAGAWRIEEKVSGELLDPLRVGSEKRSIGQRVCGMGTRFKMGEGRGDWC